MEANNKLPAGLHPFPQCYCPCDACVAWLIQPLLLPHPLQRLPAMILAGRWMSFAEFLACSARDGTTRVRSAGAPRFARARNTRAIPSVGACSGRVPRAARVEHQRGGHVEQQKEQLCRGRTSGVAVFSAQHARNPRAPWCHHHLRM
eukprot:6494336-Pyramimonas_sp.AAC.1